MTSKSQNTTFSAGLVIFRFFNRDSSPINSFSPAESFSLLSPEIDTV